jgi:hypothetical protein
MAVADGLPAAAAKAVAEAKAGVVAEAVDAAETSRPSLQSTIFPQSCPSKGRSLCPGFFSQSKDSVSGSYGQRIMKEC